MDSLFVIKYHHDLCILKLYIIMGFMIVANAIAYVSDGKK